MTPPALKQALEGFNANDLGTVLRQAGVVDIPKTKEGKVKLWMQLISDPARIRLALGKLTPRCRRALELLQAAEGELRTRRYQSLLERAGIADTERKPGRSHDRWGDSSRPEQSSDPVLFSEIFATLLKNGLIWTHTLPEGAPGNARIGFEGGRFAFIPAEVAVHLPAPPPKEQVFPQVTQTIAGSARTCQRDLYLTWSASREAPFVLTNADLLRMADLKRLSGQLLVSETVTTGSRESDYRRIFFLRRLTSALGLLESGTNGGAGVPDPGFFSAGPAERVKRSFLSWRDGAWWNELWTTYVEGKTRASGKIGDFAPPKIGEARRKVLDTLVLFTRRLQAKQKNQPIWVSFDEIADHLRDRDEEFLVDRETAERQYGGYYYSSSYRSAYSPYLYNDLGWMWEAYSDSEEKGWNGVERTFIHAVLTEGLFWLGLIDLGYGKPVTPEGGTAPAGLLAVQLTDMGRWLLLNGPQPVIPEETGRVVLQPNFRIFAFDPISDSVLARLDSFAIRLNAERAIEYELSRESVYRAQLAGQTADGIKTWLEGVTGAALPQNVARSLDEWQTAFERIVIRPHVGWLETASPELADAVLAIPALRGAVLGRPTPTGLIVRADQVDALERALLAAGELPARSSNAEDARRASVSLSEEGRIHFAHAVPSLYVQGQLQPFTDQSPAGWRITRASVTRARAAGVDAAAILATLQDMSTNGLPEALVARIKAWSKHYGSVTISVLTLLQFRDQDVLDELLADPELADYLRPFKPEAKLGLATVNHDAIDSVRDLLAQRGVDVIGAQVP